MAPNDVMTQDFDRHKEAANRLSLALKVPKPNPMATINRPVATPSQTVSSNEPIKLLSREQVIENFLSRLPPEVRTRFEQWFNEKKKKFQVTKPEMSIQPIGTPQIVKPVVNVPALEVLKNLLLKANPQ